MHGSLNVAPTPLTRLREPAPPPCHGTGPALAVQLDRSQLRVTVSGELDLASVPVLEDVLAHLLDAEPGHCTIDICDLSFIDAAGLGCLAAFADRVAAAGSTMSVVGASAHLRRVFDIVRLGALLQAS
mgnify:CR=1 FL=1